MTGLATEAGHCKCGSTDWLVGPTNNLVYNVRCKECGAYYLYFPATERWEEIEPEIKW